MGANGKVFRASLSVSAGAGEALGAASKIPGSQTTPRLTNPPESRGFLCTGKPRRFTGTAWWAMQGSNLQPLPCEGSSTAEQQWVNEARATYSFGGRALKALSSSSY